MQDCSICLVLFQWSWMNTCLSAKEKKILPETNSQGYVKSIIEYYVMGQNVTTMSVLETADALLNRDASKFASILKTKVARCY